MSLDQYFEIGKPEEKKKIHVEPQESKVIFEPKAIYEGKEKKLYTFDDSLRALRKCGYERHPRPAEAFDLICRSLEGRLQPEEQVVVDDMMKGHGEWLSMAMERKGNLLYCYLDPENLFWNGRGYSVAGKKLKYCGKKVYGIQSLSGWVCIKDVNKVNPEFIEMLLSRHYAILPDTIRRLSVIKLGLKEGIWPIGRSIFFYRYGIYHESTHMASRGVRTPAQTI